LCIDFGLTHFNKTKCVTRVTKISSYTEDCIMIMVIYIVQNFSDTCDTFCFIKMCQSEINTQDALATVFFCIA